MYLDGKDKVENEMDIVRVLRRVKYHDIALKASILNSNERMYQIKHAHQNIINTHEELMSQTESDENDANALNKKMRSGEPKDVYEEIYQGVR